MEFIVWSLSKLASPGFLTGSPCVNMHEHFLASGGGRSFVQGFAGEKNRRRVRRVEDPAENYLSQSSELVCVPVERRVDTVRF